MHEFLNEAKKFAYGESERTNMPIRLHVDLACDAGKRLARELHANVNVVEAGTLLMDCLIGQAVKEDKLDNHIAMSAQKTDELMKNSSVSPEDKENIMHCVLEHHGVEKFYSLESEICCNADCYRFVSVKGFMYALRYLRDKDFPFAGIVDILSKKVDEKWNAITLGVVKKELTHQYEIILKVLENLKNKKEF